MTAMANMTQGTHGKNDRNCKNDLRETRKNDQNEKNELRETRENINNEKNESRETRQKYRK